MPLEENVHAVPNLKTLTYCIDALALQGHGIASSLCILGLLENGYFFHMETTVWFDLILAV